MSACIVIMHADGRETIVESPQPPTLAEVQKLVGGYVELICSSADWHGEPAEVYCNEEGKLHDMRVNAEATTYIRTQIPAFWDVLAGDVVLLVGAARWSNEDEDDLDEDE